MKATVIAALLSCWLTVAYSQTEHPKTELSGTFQLDSRKAVDGFSAWLLVTPEEDFPEDLDLSVDHPSSVSEPPVLQVSESVLLLFFFADPALKADRIANVRCEFKIVRPDGTVATERAGVKCYDSRLAEADENKYVPGLIFRFRAETNDPKGEWSVYASITDLGRGASVPLRASFEVK